MSDGMRRELVYLSSHATNRYFIPNWGNLTLNSDKTLSINLLSNVRYLKILHNLALSYT